MESEIRKRTRVVAKLPNAGLANKLLVWSKAVVFCHLNGINCSSILVYPWHDLHVKRMLRFDRDQRVYRRFFKNSDVLTWLKALPVNKFALKEPEMNIHNRLFPAYKFFTIPAKEDYFEKIRGYEPVVRSEFLKLLNADNQRFFEEEKGFDLGIHVRRGDFGKAITTDITEFENAAKKIINISDYQPRIGIFTDGTPDDVKSLLKLPNSTLVTGHSALEDMLLMSKSQVIIPSPKSTFSYFAGYLSKGIIARLNIDKYAPIKNGHGNTGNEKMISQLKKAGFYRVE